MSWFDAIYGRPGRGVGPDEPEKKGLARFAQMLGRDFGQMIATNFVVCVLILPAALGVSLGVILLNFPFTLLAGLLTGLPAGVGLLLMADCALRSLSNDPSPWTYRATQPDSSRWKTARPPGSRPMTLLPALFAGAFKAHHRFVKQETIDKIYAAMPNKEDLIGKLAEMYNEPIIALMEEPDNKAGKNVEWTTNW